jgi:hypothetical protein
MDESVEKSFVKQMQDALQEQLSELEQATKQVQHDARIIANEGAKKWDELKDSVESQVKEINSALVRPLLSYSKEARGNEFILKNELSRRITRVIFEPASAAISYKGEVGEGRFVPRVEGDALEYGWNNSMPCDGIRPSRAIRVTLEDGEPPIVFLTKEMSEIIIRCVVVVPIPEPDGS